MDENVRTTINFLFCFILNSWNASETFCLFVWYCVCGWMCFCARKLELFYFIFFFILFGALLYPLCVCVGYLCFLSPWVCAMCVCFLFFYDIYSIFSFAVIYFAWVWIFYAIINKIYAIDFGVLASGNRGEGG